MIAKCCRTYKAGMSQLIINVFPTWTAKGAIAALEFGASAFERYFKEEGHLKGSALVRARYAHSTANSMSVNDISRGEFTNGVALLSNTVPVTFWVLYHIYSDPVIITECRSELRTIISDDSKNTIDMSKVKSDCPILLSTYKEVLRTYSTAVTARLVTEDHLLDGQYLLKKGGTILMPSPVQHTSDVWGDDKNAFNHRRFTRTGSQKTNPASFRAFGGGTTLCPGRHFATTEILAFVAVTILQFDIKPVSGQWMPPHTTFEFWEATKSPAQDFVVQIEPLEDTGTVGDWQFTLSGTDRPIELSAEDLK
jgi:cytochrome P450